MKAEMLNIAISQLRNRVDLIMFDINGLLSLGYSEDIALKLTDKIHDLSLSQNALEQGLSLKLQMIKLEAEVLANNTMPLQNNTEDNDSSS